MSALTITNIKDLKKWNDNPTEEAPIVMHWFMDWFMDKLVAPGTWQDALWIGRSTRTKEARDGFNTYLRFTEICEKMSREDAMERVVTNLDYYANYAVTRWAPKWKALKKSWGITGQFTTRR